MIYSFLFFSSFSCCYYYSLSIMILQSSSSPYYFWCCIVGSWPLNLCVFHRCCCCCCGLIFIFYTAFIHFLFQSSNVNWHEISILEMIKKMRYRKVFIVSFSKAKNKIYCRCGVSKKELFDKFGFSIFFFICKYIFFFLVLLLFSG